MASDPRLVNETSSRAAGASTFERVCQLIVLLFGARCAYAGRNLPVDSDGLAYLDVARAYAHHDWHTAVNGYWGPLYSWLLATVMQVFHPGIRSELALTRALNFVIFAAALYTFSRFWRAVADWGRRGNASGTSIPSTNPFVWILFGYSVFTMDFVWSVDVVNPDILVAAVVFATAGVLFKLDDFKIAGSKVVDSKISDLNLQGRSKSRQHGVAIYAWLGLLLAVGYYAKAILLFFGIFVLAALFIQGSRSRRLLGPITAALVFALLISPFAISLSMTLGHFTAGDSGRLNYAWFVDGPETKTWMKDSSDGALVQGAPLPFYPGPLVFNSPSVFRVPELASVTYAPWYDAARFDKRSHPVFRWRDQLRQLAINLRYTREQLFGEGAALTVPLLILFWHSPRESLRRFAATWFCTLPALAIFGMYLLVHLVERFVMGFSLLLWGAILVSIFVPPQLQLLARRAMLAGIIVFATYTMPGLLHYVVSQRSESVARDVAIAEAVPNYGISPHDPVASIGDGQIAYWAHFAELSVVDEIWSNDELEFWSADPAVQRAALHAMADSGAKAAVWRRDSERVCPEGWFSLPGNSGCIIPLH